MFPPTRMRHALNLSGLTIREVSVRTYSKMLEHEIMTRAAAVSFYAMLAIVPFLGLVIFFTVRLLPDLTTGFGSRSAGIGNLTTEEFRQLLSQVFPKEVYEVIEGQVGRLQSQTRPSLSLLVLGFGVTLWLSSSLFVAVIDALNRIGGVSETRSYVRIYSTAFAMTLVEAVILVGSLLAIVLWPQILNWMGMSEIGAWFATLIQWIVVFVLVIFSFALTFYVAPDSDQRWEWISPGSIVGTIAFLVASFGFRQYVQNFSNYDKTYGSLGGVMALLLWFWISSVVLLTSAQFNQIIEEASPLGKNHGQKADLSEAPDFKAMTPTTSPNPISAS